MSAPSESARRYRFPELRRAGLFGAVPPALCVVGAVALVVAWMVIASVVPVVVGVVVGVGCLWVAFGTVRERPVHEVGPAIARWCWKRVRRRNRWYWPVALLADGETEVSVPPVLADLELYEVDIDWHIAGSTSSVGVVRDRRSAMVTIVLRVCGDGQFGLVDEVEQDARLDRWGTALAGFAREHSPVARVTFHDWTAPVPMRDTVTRLEASWADEPEHPARAGYLALLAATSALVVNHEVLVEVTVDLRRVRRARTGTTLAAGLRTVCEEARLFRDRLSAAGLRVDAVLSAADIVTATRLRGDPSTAEQLATLRRSLAVATGESAPMFGPMYLDDQLGSVQVDGAWHRSWWFARWPRRDVPAGWLEHLVTTEGCTRSLTTVFEPVAPSRSDASVQVEISRREANIEASRQKGSRPKRRDTRAAQDAEEREDELTSGFVECRYTGLVTVTASSVDALELHAADIEGAAANVGVELRPLWGHQAEGWVASLPLGRNLARQVGDRA